MVMVMAVVVLWSSQLSGALVLQDPSPSSACPEVLAVANTQALGCTVNAVFCFLVIFQTKTKDPVRGAVFICFAFLLRL